jgi:hypothetical protein
MGWLWGEPRLGGIGAGRSFFVGGFLRSNHRLHAKQQRLAPFERYHPIQQAGPITGRGSDRHCIRDAQFYLADAKPRRFGLAQCFGRYEFIIDAVVDQESEATVSRVFDGQRPFGTGPGFQR